jgi:ankyrin repeat protein
LSQEPRANPWPRMQHKTIFVSCSQDMAYALPMVEGLVQELNARLPQGDHWAVYHWSKSDTVWLTDGTWQDYIPRASDPNVDAVICLFGERIGEPLPSYFQLPSGFNLPSWVQHPWTGLAKDRVPLTGTTFELLDAMQTKSEQRQHNRVLTYVKADSRRFYATDLLPDERAYGLEHHYDALRGSAKRIRNLEEDLRYRTQIAWLDRFYDEFFRKTSRPVICYGADGQGLYESLEALRTQLSRDLEQLFGLTQPVEPAELKGLAAYEPADADLLFGRDRTIERILEHFEELSHSKRPLAVLLGRNGEGKSSVLRAGLVGRLKKARYPRYGKFLPVLIDAFSLVDEAPLLKVADAVQAVLERPLWPSGIKLGDFLPHEQPVKFAEAIRTSLNTGAAIPGMAPRLFIAIDQFEELLVPAGEYPAIGAGLNQLLTALTLVAEDNLAWVAFALPIDHEARFKSVAAALPFSEITISPVGEDDIRDIVVKSFSATGFVDAANASEVNLPDGNAEGVAVAGDRDALIENIIAQCVGWLRRAEEPGPVLPLLSLLLTEVVANVRPKARREREPFQFNNGMKATEGHQAPHDLMGVLGRLAERAWGEAQHAGAPNLETSFARILRQLVMTGTTEKGRLKLLRNCSADHGVAIQAQPLISAMRKHRLIYSPDAGQIRLAHVAIIDHWERAAAWYAQDSVNQLTLVSLASKSEAWEAARASGRAILPELDIQGLDALEDLWIAWIDDKDRLPLEFMRAQMRAAFDPVARRESWKRGDGRSRFHSIVATQDAELIAHAMNRLDQIDAETRQEISDFQSPLTRNTALFSAAWYGNVDLTSWLIKSGAEVNRGNGDNTSALHWAASNGHRDVVHQLIAAGADVRAQNDMQITPLHWAASGGHTDIVVELIAAGADVGALSNTRATPLHWASLNGHDAVVTQLVLAGSAVNSRDEDELTPLQLAVTASRANVVHVLLDNAADVDVRDKDGSTPLIVAASLGDRNVIAGLLAHNADMLTTNSEGRTALHVAARRDKPEAINALIGAGAAVQGLASDGATPLVEAIMAGAVDACRCLLRHGSNIAYRTRTNTTPLMFADFRTMPLLLESGAKPDDINDDGWNAVLFAARRNDRSLALLVENGCDPEVRSHNGTTPLMVASSWGNRDVVGYLIKRGIDVNASDLDGWTALMMAVVSRDLGMCKMLVDAGVNINAETAAGITAGKLAVLFRIDKQFALLARISA